MPAWVGLDLTIFEPETLLLKNVRNLLLFFIHVPVKDSVDVLKFEEWNTSVVSVGKNYSPLM